MHNTLRKTIYNYLEKQYPIEKDTIQINDIRKNFHTRLNASIYTQKELKGITLIDIEIIDIFGSKINPYFFQWAEKRIGKTIQLQFTDRIVTYKNRKFVMTREDKLEFLDSIFASDSLRYHVLRQD